MMNRIFGALIVVSIVCAIMTGRLEDVSNAILSGATEAIQLVFSLFGMMCFWTGMMKIADKGGATTLLAKFLSPAIGYLFPDYKKSGRAIKTICMNLVANFLGLGNAATPIGITAMKEMQREKQLKGVADNSMVMFVVFNTASVQLIPTSMAVLRKAHGSVSPFDVMPAVWISSIAALAVGITVAKILEKRKKSLG
ncbi:MAG: spore maturation protein A [Oscillospiraceae bacterium]|jgi:spore maturation protein A|nr:spore maturation protein A [Oscillospiraceae bacterium]